MAEVLQEKWMKGVAVTTTVLAVMTSIAAARGAACALKTQNLTACENSKWAYYQAKSIKQNLADSQRNAFEVEMLGAANPEQRIAYEEKLKACVSEIARYDKEKNDIKAEAEALGAENALLSRKASRFSVSIVFFQIGIMLSSVSALLKRRDMWYFGLVLGLVAASFLAHALFLKPLLF